MLNKIIAFSLRNRLAVIFLTLALIVGGLYAFTKLPIDAVPDITNNQVQVLTSAPALSPLEVEQFVTAPLELSLKTLPNIVELRSISRPGLSVITLVFRDNVDIYFARQQVHERMSEAEENLPSSSSKPELAPISTGLGEIFRYVVKDKTGRLSPMDLRTVQDWIIRRQLQGVPGLAEVNSLGGEVKQVHVLADPVALSGYGLTLHDLYESVSRASGNAGGAYIENGAEQYNVRSVGLAVNVDDLKNAVVKATQAGTPILLKDVAQVEIGPALRFGSASQDGKGEVVTGITMQLKGANSRVTVQGVKAKLEEIKSSLPPGVVIEPYYDREELVDRTIETVFHNLLEGAVFVIAVLLLFLANLRAGLILASVIPLTMLFAAICMVLTGQTGNLMSLGAIDFGLLVDGSLIIVEGCLRLISKQLEENSGTELTSDQTFDLLYRGSSEVLQAAKFGVLIIILVYLPILTLQGIEGKFFRPMALTVSYALIGALLLSVTYVPMMCFYFLQRKGHIKESKIIDFLKDRYLPLLNRAFDFRKTILIAVSALLIMAVVIFSGMGGEFIPRLDEGDISMSLIRLPSISLTESQKLATEVEKRLKRFTEVKTVVSHTGRAEISTDPMGVELSDVFIILRPESDWTSKRSKPELIEAMQAALADVPGIGTQFLQPIEMRMNELIAGVKGDVAIKIFGDDFDVLNPAAEKVARALRGTQGSSDVTVEQTTGLPQLVITPDRSQIARYGLRIEDINEIVSTAIGGQKAGELFEGERRSDVVIRYNEASRGSLEAIQAIQVPTPTGQSVTLGSVATIQYEDAPAQVSRENGSRFITVQSNVRDRDVESFVSEVQSKLRTSLKLPAGYTVHYGGQFENLRAASKRLQIVVPLALLLIFVLLYQTFKSIKLGIMIFLCVPLAVIGGIAALLIGGLPFSISAGVGFIALFGIAVLNGIVMVAAIRKYQESILHHDTRQHVGNVADTMREAILKGAEERFRPVVTTAALAGLGFLPMLLASGAGAEVQRPLATVIIGGLVSSTLLTLFVLPLVYEYFARDRRMAGKRLPTQSIVTAFVTTVILLFGSLGSTRAFAQTDSKVYDLNALKRSGIEHSFEVARATAILRRDRALQSAATTLPAPEVFCSIDERGKDAPGKTALGISQSMDFPLVYAAEKTARGYVAEQSEARIERIRREIEHEITLQYLVVVADDAELALADSAVVNAERFSSAVERKREAGEINALEALQPSVALATAHRRRASQQTELMQSLSGLRIITGLSPSDSILIRNREGSGVASPSLLDVANAPFDYDSGHVLERSPQLMEASIGAKAARARENVLRYERWPSLGLAASRQTIDGTTGYYGAELRLGLPLWKWFNSSDIYAAQAETASIDAEREIALRSLRTEFSAARGRYRTAVATLQSIETDLIPRAREAYRVALRLNELGEATYLEVLTAQNTLIEAESDRITAVHDRDAALADIQYLTSSSHLQGQ